MFLSSKKNKDFVPITEHVLNTAEKVTCSGAAAFVIHNDKVVLEAYFGSQSNKSGSRIVQEDTQFHVASVRKSYIGFAVAYAVYCRKIKGIDDLILHYFPGLDEDIWKDTTIRHVLTHTHGLHKKEGTVFREFPAGENWSYRQVGIDVLTELVKQTTGKTVSEIVHEQVFNPFEFNESNWYARKQEKLVDVILGDDSDKNWNISESTEGNKMNMYVSARELAYWGYVHLKKGYLYGKQMIPKEIIQMAATIQSPSTIDKNLPQNGFLWFVKDLPAEKTEIGQSVPKGAYQILGYTGVALLVIPQENIVAVRMFNSFGSPEGYDYLSDVRSFGDTVMRCLS